jgi:integrase
MAGMKNRNRFLNFSLQIDKTTNIFDEILKTDLNYIPNIADDEEGDLSRKVLKTDYVIEYFLKNRPNGTCNIYFDIIVQFCLFNRMTPAQLIKEALIDENQVSLQKTHVLKIQFFYNFLDKSGYVIEHPNGEIETRKYASKSLHSKIATVKSFYLKFGLDTPKTLNNMLPLDEAQKSHEYIFKKEEIADILNYANIEMKAIVLAQTSSGLSGVDIRNLTIGQYEKGKRNIKRQIIKDDGVQEFVDVTLCMLILKRQKTQKTNKEFITFFSPETCEAIDAYLAHRNYKADYTNKKQIVAYQKRRYDIDIENGISKDEIQLFINQEIRADFLNERDEKYRIISRHTLIKMYKSLSIKCGKSTSAYNWNYVRSHNMRKYFGNILENNTSKPNLVRHMMGHKSGGVENAYYKPLQDKLQTFYVNECLPLVQFKETETIKFIDHDAVEYRKTKALMAKYNKKAEWHESKEKDYRDSAEKAEDIVEYKKFINLANVEEEKKLKFKEFVYDIMVGKIIKDDEDELKEN